MMSSIYFKHEEKIDGKSVGKGRAATQKFDCHFAMNDIVETEYTAIQSPIDGGPLVGCAHSEHSVHYPWYEAELENVQFLTQVTILARLVKSYR